MEKAKMDIGRWTRLFGEALPFHLEAARAKVVRSTASEVMGQLHVLIEDELPGWEIPLWGSDSEWLYLRRPEGVWKTRLPQQLPGLVTLLCSRDSRDRSIIHGTYVGVDLVNRGGWFIRDGEEQSPEEIDKEICASQAEKAIADEFGWPLLHERGRDGSRVIYEAGDAFPSPPSLTSDGKWVIGTDRVTGRRVAFAMSESAKISLMHEELWLRFGSDWLQPFEARVSL